MVGLAGLRKKITGFSRQSGQPGKVNALCYAEGDRSAYIGTPRSALIDSGAPWQSPFDQFDCAQGKTFAPATAGKQGRIFGG